MVRVWTLLRWTLNFIYDLLKENDIHHRGGYDQRSVPGRFEPNHPALFEKRIITVMEPVSLDEWEVAIGPIGPLCKSIDRIQTRKENITKTNSCHVCSFYDLNASSHCNAMSIGSNDQWGLETEVVSATGCHTHAFDCTKTSPLNKPNLDSVSFYSACISHEDNTAEGRKYMTYQSLWKRTGMKVPPKMLKIDVRQGFCECPLSSYLICPLSLTSFCTIIITFSKSQVEGFEFDVLVSMVTSKDNEEIFNVPDQIVVELHTATRIVGTEALQRKCSHHIFTRSFFLPSNSMMKPKSWERLLEEIDS